MPCLSPVKLKQPQRLNPKLVSLDELQRLAALSVVGKNPFKMTKPLQQMKTRPGVRLEKKSPMSSDLWIHSCIAVSREMVLVRGNWF